MKRQVIPSVGRAAAQLAPHTTAAGAGTGAVPLETRLVETRLVEPSPAPRCQGPPGTCGGNTARRRHSLLPGHHSYGDSLEPPDARSGHTAR